MRTLTKAILGMTMLAGSALAIATPANAQSSFGFYIGNGVDRSVYVDRDDYRGGFWRWDPYLHRRVWIPARDFYRGRGWDRDGYFDRDDYRRDRDFDRDHDRDRGGRR